MRWLIVEKCFKKSKIEPVYFTLIKCIFQKFNTMSTAEIQSKIDDLKSKLSGDMMKDMEIRDQIHNLEMTMNGVKPEDSHFDCIGCGS